MGGRPQAGGLLCSLHPTLFSMAWPRPSSLAFLPIPWVAAAKVGLDDAAQLKLRGLGGDHGQKRTRTILLPCRMTLPCSIAYTAIGAVPQRCKNFVPYAPRRRTTLWPTIARRSLSRGTAAFVSDLSRRTHEHVLLRLISEARKTRFRYPPSLLRRLLERRLANPGTGTINRLCYVSNCLQTRGHQMLTFRICLHASSTSALGP